MDLYAFKIYMLDVGLLLAMADPDASVIIDGNRIFAEFKGALTEQYVLQQGNPASVSMIRRRFIDLS